jgi:hypothetical protein
MIEITDSEASSLVDLIDFSLIDVIRDYTDIDSLLWLDNIMSVWRKCGGRKECADGD